MKRHSGLRAHPHTYPPPRAPSQFATLPLLDASTVYSPPAPTTAMGLCVVPMSAARAPLPPPTTTAAVPSKPAAQRFRRVRRSKGEEELSSAAD